MARTDGMRERLRAARSMLVGRYVPWPLRRVWRLGWRGLDTVGLGAESRRARRLTGSDFASGAGLQRLPGALDPARPVVDLNDEVPLSVPAATRRDVPGGVAVFGVWLRDRPSLAATIATALADDAVMVRQAWIAMGGPQATTTAEPPVLLEHPDGLLPRATAINRLLTAHAPAIDASDYVVLVDDDVVLPPRFLARVIGVMQAADWALAQPARCVESTLDHPITGQQPGVLGREGAFVEVGPCVIMRADAARLLLPFDEVSPMTWGHEYVWAKRIADAGLRMGIIDAVPVRHDFRPPAQYGVEDAKYDEAALLAKHAHVAPEAATILHQTVPPQVRRP